MIIEPVIFGLNLSSTFYLLGLIWTIQVIHYPTFPLVGEHSFTEFEDFHKRRITPIVGPAMIMELISSVLLVGLAPEFLPTWIGVAGVLLVLVIWISTIAIQVPIHKKLSIAKDLESIKMLVASNWIRTAAWSLRSVLLAWILIAMLTRSGSGS